MRPSTIPSSPERHRSPLVGVRVPLVVLATLALPFAGAARAQEVTSAAPRVLRLVKGGDAGTVVLQGRGLTRIAGVRVLHADGRPDGAVELRHGPVRRSGLPVRIEAGPRARAGRHTLELSVPTAVRRGRVPVRWIPAPVRLVFYNPLRFDRVEPASVTVEPGGPGRAVSLTGGGFGQLSNPRLLRASRPVPGAEAEIGDRTGGRATIRLSAAEATPTGRYALVADAVEGRVEIPVGIDVARAPAPDVAAAVPGRRPPAAEMRVIPPPPLVVDTGTLRMTGWPSGPFAVDTEPLRMTGWPSGPFVVDTGTLRMTGAWVHVEDVQ